MLRLESAKYISEYKLEVHFNDGRSGIADLSDLVHKAEPNVFRELIDPNNFKTFTVEYTIIWNEHLDVAPEYLFFKAFENDPSLKDQFKEWGYAA